ncbi:MAG: hypothetical protein IPL39_08200 [Opitutaceae bacterium]|nr:hypothetical protein [Opitutaceae bacterium]
MLNYLATFIPFRFRGLVPWLKDRVERWAFYRDLAYYGDSVPAKVIELSSGTIAVYTDLDKSCVHPVSVIKVIPQALTPFGIGKLTEGSYLPAIAYYGGETNEHAARRWDDFVPIPALFLVGSDKECAQVVKRIHKSAWDALDFGLSRLGADLQPGLNHFQMPKEIQRPLGREVRDGLGR